MAGDNTDSTRRPDTCCCIEITCSHCKNNRGEYEDNDPTTHRPNTEVQSGTVHGSQADSEPVRGPSLLATATGGATDLFCTTHTKEVPLPQQGATRNGDSSEALTVSGGQGMAEDLLGVDLERGDVLMAKEHAGDEQGSTRAGTGTDPETTHVSWGDQNTSYDNLQGNWGRTNRFIPLDRDRPYTLARSVDPVTGLGEGTTEQGYGNNIRASGLTIGAYDYGRRNSLSEVSTRRTTPIAGYLTSQHHHNREEIDAILARYRPGQTQAVGSVPITIPSTPRAPTYAPLSSSTHPLITPLNLRSTATYYSTNVTATNSHSSLSITPRSLNVTTLGSYISTTHTPIRYLTGPNSTTTYPCINSSRQTSKSYSLPSTLASSFTTFRSSLDREFNHTLSRVDSAVRPGGRSTSIHHDIPSLSSSPSTYHGTLYGRHDSYQSPTNNSYTSPSATPSRESFSALSQTATCRLSSKNGSNPRLTSRYTTPPSYSGEGPSRYEQLPSWTRSRRAVSVSALSGGSSFFPTSRTERSLAATNEWLRSRKIPSSLTKWASKDDSSSTTTFGINRYPQDGNSTTNPRGKLSLYVSGYPRKLHFQIPCVFPVWRQIFPVPMCVICDYYIHKTDLADLSSFKFFLEIFAANFEISFTFRTSEFTT